MPTERPLRHALTLAVAAGLALVLVAPLLGEGSWIHHLLAPLCHQMPGRSPALFGVTLPLCWRCLGVWAGVAIFLLAGRHERFGDRRAWPWLLSLGVLDWGLSQANLVADVGGERLVSGLCLGLGLGLAARAALVAAAAPRWPSAARHLRATFFRAATKAAGPTSGRSVPGNSALGRRTWTAGGTPRP